MTGLQVTPKLPPPEAIERLIIHGDLRHLSAEQKTEYYMRVCESVGLNPLTRPFDYIVLNGKETLYAKRDAADQLRRIHTVSIKLGPSEVIEGVYKITAFASMPSGRTDESTGAVSIGGLKGEALANAIMKAETKAKRRVTLCICGLGILDETELDSVPGHKQHEPIIQIPEVAEARITPRAEQQAPQAQDEVPLPDPPAKREAPEYVADFGKYRGKSLHEVGAEDAKNYAQWLVSDAAKKNKQLDGKARIFVDRVGQAFGN